MDRNSVPLDSRAISRAVALLAEGVDRNYESPELAELPEAVALLAEGVDRNHVDEQADYPQSSRPPRGGRG